MKRFLLFFVIIFLTNGCAFSEDDNYYFSYPLKASWFKAVETCKFKNMQLVSALTPDSVNEIQAYIDGLQFDTISFDEWANSIWTSGNDLGENGQYTCASTGKQISDNLLKSPHINHQNHANCMTEHCLTLARKSGNSFILNDDLCSNLRYFLCERVAHNNVENVYDEYYSTIVTRR